MSMHVESAETPLSIHAIVTLLPDSFITNNTRIVRKETDKLAAIIYIWDMFIGALVNRYSGDVWVLLQP